MDGRGASRIAGPDLGRYARDRRNVAAPGRSSGEAPAIVFARTERRARHAKKPAEPAPQEAGPKRPPARIPFTAEEDAAAIVPGMPEARFWADSETDFKNALPEQPGPWLVLSSGGSDGAFGAGLLNGLTRPASGPITRSSPASAPVR